MWCVTSDSTCSSSPSRSSRQRNSGPAKVEGRRASSAKSPRSRPRARRAQPERSVTGSTTSRASPTSWTGPPPAREGRAQHLVAAHHPPRARERAPRRRTAAQAQREGDVIEGGVRHQPVEEPEPLLRERQGTPRRAPAARGEAEAATAPRSSSRPRPSRPAPRRLRTRRARGGQLDVKGFAHARDDADG